MERCGHRRTGGKWRREQRRTNSAGVGSPEAHSQHLAGLLPASGSTPAPRCSPGDLSDDDEGRHPVLLPIQHMHLGLCDLLPFSCLQWTCLLSYCTSLKHSLRCILLPSKHFVAGGLQPIQTITSEEWQLNVVESRNSYDVAQHSFVRNICKGSAWFAEQAADQQNHSTPDPSPKKAGKEGMWHSDWKGNMRITPTSHSAWGGLKLLAVNVFNDEHQDVQIWLREGMWKLAKVF